MYGQNHHFIGHLRCQYFQAELANSPLLAGAGQKISALSQGLILPNSVRKKNQMSCTVDSVYQVHFASAREKDTSGLSSDIGRFNINAASNVLISKILGPSSSVLSLGSRLLNPGIQTFPALQVNGWIYLLKNDKKQGPKMKSNEKNRQI